MASNLIATASNLIAVASNQIAMASNLIAMASNQIATASNLIAMASNLTAMASNLIASNSDGLQANGNGLQPNSTHFRSSYQVISSMFSCQMLWIPCIRRSLFMKTRILLHALSLRCTAVEPPKHERDLLPEPSLDHRQTIRLSYSPPFSYPSIILLEF